MGPTAPTAVAAGESFAATFSSDARGGSGAGRAPKPPLSASIRRRASEGSLPAKPAPPARLNGGRRGGRGGRAGRGSGSVGRGSNSAGRGRGSTGTGASTSRSSSRSRSTSNSRNRNESPATARSSSASRRRLPSGNVPLGSGGRLGRVESESNSANATPQRGPSPQRTKRPTAKRGGGGAGGSGGRSGGEKWGARGSATPPSPTVEASQTVTIEENLQAATAKQAAGAPSDSRTLEMPRSASWAPSNSYGGSSLDSPTTKSEVAAHQAKRKALQAEVRHMRAMTEEAAGQDAVGGE